METTILGRPGVCFLGRPGCDSSGRQFGKTAEPCLLATRLEEDSEGLPFQGESGQKIVPPRFLKSA